MTVTVAPSGGPLPLTVGATLSGLFNSLNDEADSTVFLYLAFGLSSNPASTFDDGMTRFEFVLVKCRFVAIVDFVMCDWLTNTFFLFLWVGFLQQPCGRALRLYARHCPRVNKIRFLVGVNGVL
jgi:hypothetical protein